MTQSTHYIKNAKDLGVLLRRTRKSAKLTQAQAAGLCGVSIPFYNALENGKPTIQFDKTLHVCTQMGINIQLHLPDLDL